jgi:hypothetical protein
MKSVMTLTDFLAYFDFSYTEDIGGIHLVDETGTNLGDIQSETFSDVSEVVDRLGIYYHDYIYENLSRKDLSFSDVLYKGEENYFDMEKWLNKVRKNDIRFVPYYNIVKCIVNPNLIEKE